MPSAVHLVPYGTAALDVLRRVLSDRHPLDRVHVVVPSALVGVTVRRALADAGGHAGLAFTSLPQLAEQIAVLGGATAVGPLPALRLKAQLRAAVEGDSRWPDAVATPSGLEVLARVLDELDSADPTVAREEQATSEGGRTVAVLDLLAPHRTSPKALLAGAEQWAGRVVLYLPRRLSSVERELCHVLHDRGVLHAVLGLTGEPGPDEPSLTLAALLGSASETDAAVLPSSPTRVLAPDPEEEVRQAVRRVLTALGEGAVPHRLALTYRSTVPYARLVREQLAAAGVPHHAPRLRSLAQTTGGRVLLGLLALPEQDWSRQAVLTWCASGPLRHPNGSQLMVTRWDTAARKAGITRGLGSWAPRLDILRGDEQSRVPDEDLDGMLGMLAALVADVEATAGAATWQAFGDSCRSALAGWLRAPEHWRGPDGSVRLEADQRALVDVENALSSLACLDGQLPLPVSLSERRDAVATALERTVHEGTGLGRGVLTAPLRDLAGADLDLVVVLGLVEGAFPPRPREHPLLRDAARRPLGLLTTADQRHDERHDLLAVIAGARAVVLSAPAGDLRAQRPLHPSPWFVGGAEPAAITSFAKATSDAPTKATAQEHLMSALLGSDLEVTALSPGLTRGLEAVDDRRRGVFGPWLGGLTVLDEQAQKRLNRSPSASALQTYATCPFRWFADKALGVRERDEPAEDAVSALDRGLLLHSVLETVVDEHRDQAPDSPWSADAHALASRILGKEAAALASAGKAGRPAVWAVEVERARRRIRTFLLQDDAYRRTRRVTPLGTEVAFGLDEDGPPPLELTLPSGRTVSLRGSIDRIDVGEAGDLVVLDYKSGGIDKYKADFPLEGADEDPADLTGRGRFLQLPLYALAAKRAQEAPDASVEGYYSFLDHGGVRRGGLVDARQERRLLEVLDVTTHGMASGVFPARSGEFNDFYRSFDNCGFCAFDRMCSSGRDDQWTDVRKDTRVAAYAALADGGLDQ